MIETARLILRPWRKADLPAWTAMMTDPEVGRWLGGPFSPEAAEEGFRQAAAIVAGDGYGMWAAERKSDGAVIGSIGVRRVRPEWNHPLSGSTELGWRLARPAWGAGYASEGAAAALAWAWANLPVDEIVAFTAVPNVRSQAVMKRLGMIREPLRDFDHPALAPDHPLRRHLVFGIARPR
ncbi:MAG TPA: GNAT family N-acetyltransferase [Caulobacteraceae bacterium]|nr:GNAT family N-acetyltransferase [Caulobacteraceae bacterium]